MAGDCACGKCRAPGSNLVVEDDYLTEAMILVRVVRCRLCSWRVEQEVSSKMTREVTFGSISRMQMTPCTVVGCDGDFFDGNSRYRMCKTCSAVHRRWVDKAKRGGTAPAPFHWRDGKWYRA